MCVFFTQKKYILFIVITYRLFGELNKIKSGLQFKLNAILNIIQMENALKLSAGVVSFRSRFFLFISSLLVQCTFFDRIYWQTIRLRTFYTPLFFSLLNNIAWQRTFFTHCNTLFDFMLIYFYDVAMCVFSRAHPNKCSLYKFSVVKLQVKLKLWMGMCKCMITSYERPAFKNCFQPFSYVALLENLPFTLLLLLIFVFAALSLLDKCRTYC